MSVGSAVSTSRHLVRRGGEANFAVPPPFVDRSKGFKRWALVGEESPAVHTGFAMCTLEAGGWVAAHLHSYEECVYLLEGEAQLTTTEGTFRLRAGDYGVIPVGVIHSWRGLPKGARWAQMMAPQPRARFGSDTYFPTSSPSDNAPPLGEGRVAAAIPIDVRDPRTRSFGHIEASNMDVSQQTQDQLAVSASMRTALLAYSGITVKMMVDSDLGAELSTMFMVQYEPSGVAGQHDHPFEETYLIVEGSVDATFDGEAYRMEKGDIAFAGVGCVHGFSNPASTPVRWLETQAPQPPGRHSYRFARDWDYLTSRIDPPKV
ncbi:MAG: cupin domain-containing protein [Chloroflexi bacterium]|nr:MAG: cupin domain-containing protein [Chloroflexota bacterium]